MPNGHTEQEPAAATYEQIYRQYVITLSDTGSFDDQSAELDAALKQSLVDYRKILTIEEARLVAIEVAKGEDASRLVNDLRRRSSLIKAVEQNRPLRPAAVVNDPLYWDQWGLLRIGAPQAWAHATGIPGPGVIVAITDSGIHTLHPDLAGHLWNDAAGNHGVNLLDLTFDVSDTVGHGTLLAGTIGAISNNAIGIAAAQWPIRMMAVKFYDVRTPPNALSGGLAILWALMHGARVITAAWGVGVPYVFLQTIMTIANAMGAIVIAAAGNDGLDNDQRWSYPANYGALPDNLPNVVSVMASEFLSLRNWRDYDDKAWFSNYGRTKVHLAAPGEGILSTQAYFGAPRWRAYSGTSAACALVTYAAALLKAMNPAWSPAQLRQHLIDSVDLSPWLALKCVARGRLSLDRAVRPFVITAPMGGAVWPAGASNPVTWTRRYATAGATSVRLLVSQGGAPFMVVAAGLPNTGAGVAPPLAAAPVARVRIQSEQGPGLYEDSAAFSVV